MFHQENVNDWEPLKQGKFLKIIKRKLCVDKEDILLCLRTFSLMVYSLSLKLKQYEELTNEYC